MSRNPRKSFLCCLSSGILNILDGMCASLLNQRTLFGFFLDGFLDRLTTTVFMFYLITLMPKYWLLIFLVKFIEFSSDLLSHQSSNFENVFKIYTFIYDEAEFSVKGGINKTQLPLSKLLDTIVTAGKPTFELILDQPSTSESPQTEDWNLFVNKYIYLAVWTLNDLFYWLLLFKSQSHSSDNLPMSSNFSDLSFKKDSRVTGFNISSTNCRYSDHVPSLLSLLCSFCALVSFILNLRNFLHYVNQILAIDKCILEIRLQ